MLRELINDLLTAYGAVLFTGRRRTGLLFLAATFLQLHHGFYGLLGALSAHLFAKLYFADRAYFRAGIFGAAGLLTGLALSLYLSPSLSMLFLVPLAAIFAAVLCAMLTSWLGWQYGLSATALPFVLASWVGLLSTRMVPQSRIPISQAHSENYIPWLLALNEHLTARLPDMVNLFLRVIGATSFQTSVLAGLLILTGILLGTRITAIAMVVGAGIGILFVNLFVHAQLFSEETALTAFNCVFAAGALCGVFVLPNWRGIFFALLGTVLVGVLAVATKIFLAPSDLPPLAFPFAIGILILLFPFRLGILKGIHVYPLANVGTAESNLRQYWRWRRTSGNALTSFRMPHYGQWTLTQSVDGQPTHNGIGKYAWDLMLLDRDKRSASYPCLSLTDYYGYGLPVLAPAAGTVVAFVNYLPDNPPQTVDTENPFGNYVSIYHSKGEYSLLAHLQNGSVKVAIGQHVNAGQEVGRVGNSGRSPEPHLHVQLQSDWYPGAQTLSAKWASLVAKRGNQTHYLAEGELLPGDLITDFVAQFPTKLEDYFPFSIIGGEWNYRLSSGFTTDDVIVKIRSGLYGRFLLDDGKQVLNAVKTSGHWYLDALDEADPDHTGSGKSGLLSLFGPALAVLPLQFGNYVWENDVHGFRMASQLKRMLELPGSGRARSDGYKLIPQTDGSKLLRLVLAITTETNQELRYELEFVAGIGLIHAVMFNGKKQEAELFCREYKSRLLQWQFPSV